MFSKLGDRSHYLSYCIHVILLNEHSSLLLCLEFIINDSLMMNFFNLPLWLAITMLTTETHWETILILLVTEFPELYTTNREQSDK